MLSVETVQSGFPCTFGVGCHNPGEMACQEARVCRAVPGALHRANSGGELLSLNVVHCEYRQRFLFFKPQRWNELALESFTKS